MLTTLDDFPDEARLRHLAEDCGLEIEGLEACFRGDLSTINGIYTGIPRNGDAPNWMVYNYNRKNPMKIDDLVFNTPVGG